MKWHFTSTSIPFFVASWCWDKADYIFHMLIVIWNILHDFMVYSTVIMLDDFYSIVVTWLLRQEERLQTVTPVATPVDPSPSIHTPSTSSIIPAAAFCPPSAPPLSITPGCGKLYLRRDSTTSSCDPADRMEWLTYEVSIQGGIDWACCIWSLNLAKNVWAKREFKATCQYGFWFPL